MFYATIVEDGQVLGVWKRVIKSKSIDVFCTRSLRLNPSQMAHVETQIEAYADF